MVKFLLEEVGLKVDTIRDDYHRTPLHDAFWTPTASYEVVDLLLQQPNVAELLLLPDKRGFTPLSYARKEDHGKWLRFLWERKSILRTSYTATCATFSTPKKEACEQYYNEHDSCTSQLVKRQRLCSIRGTRSHEITV